MRSQPLTLSRVAAAIREFARTATWSATLRDELCAALDAAPLPYSSSVADLDVSIGDFGVLIDGATHVSDTMAEITRSVRVTRVTTLIVLTARPTSAIPVRQVLNASIIVISVGSAVKS